METRIGVATIFFIVGAVLLVQSIFNYFGRVVPLQREVDAIQTKSLSCPSDSPEYKVIIAEKVAKENEASTERGYCYRKLGWSFLIIAFFGSMISFQISVIWYVLSLIFFSISC